MQTTRLTDFEFFTACVDSSIPALSSLPALAEAGKYAEAQKVFAAYVRSQLNPALYLAGKREELEKKRVRQVIDAHMEIRCVQYEAHAYRNKKTKRIIYSAFPANVVNEVN